jgi:hypothetical protein
MALSRRNMLLGLIVLVVGAGVIGASGAFTSVQAERTMDIQTAGDSNALLALTPNDSAITGTDADDDSGQLDLLEISNNSINEDAVTVFGSAFTATNNGTEDVGLFIQADTDNGIEAGGSGAVDFEVEGHGSIVGSGNAVTLGAGGGAEDIDIQLDTTGDTTQADIPTDGTITIVANASAAN